MDFLEIRRKAKERAAAAARASPVPAETHPATPPPLPPPPAVAGATPAASSADAPPREAPPARGGPHRPGDGAGDYLSEFFLDDAEVPREDLAAAGAAAAPPEAAAEPREHLTFKLADEEYAVAIERVREVLKAPAITEVPRAPDHVLGVIMVRGQVVAVFDPRRRLALPPRAPSRTSRVVVCDAGHESIGLLVDGVTEVVRLRPSEVEARPQGIGGDGAECISGIGRQGARMFILLDLAAVLRASAVTSSEDDG